jgi:hypothetical protein
MPRPSIQQFRAALASRSGQGALVQAYRELARRSAAEAAALSRGWAEWPQAAARG